MRKPVIVISYFIAFPIIACYRFNNINRIAEIRIIGKIPTIGICCGTIVIVIIVGAVWWVVGVATAAVIIIR